MKKVPLAQWIFFIVAILYLLESILLAGLFTNILLLFATLVAGVIVIIISIIKKQWNWAFFDLVTCLACSGIAVYLYSL
ncbi:hypothetical protein [Turicibacter sanguinis]|uniref:Uncharacterized protein n=2 Tax=Turicibacter sanguinis TaxID=154288 RepID=A0A6I3NA00_9FIRM|nr:hypothetical protein [Turicibacter sanguinis]KAB3587135.1 hypothetical protein GAY13_23620 [Phocaeicola vulgatus]EFF65136.1 hypothetical protein CUW_0555 [Turicibacter sanguinis PC909]MDB8564602.1 hypothetical protein [Turicibacter sanguinis]MDB8576430.1 hypothetical protein [Turicibacter sanguinis]MDB8579455.1 hypothetical protein [Turicibacter sanguinis]